VWEKAKERERKGTTILRQLVWYRPVIEIYVDFFLFLLSIIQNPLSKIIRVGVGGKKKK